MSNPAIQFPAKRETLSELYYAIRALTGQNAPVQKVKLVKKARFMQRRAACHATHFGIRIQQRAHEGFLYIRRAQ